MDDCPVSGGRLLGGIAQAGRALEAHLRLHIDTLQARVRVLKGVVATRKGYIQEEIARSLAYERDLREREREREAHTIATKREGSALS